VDFDIADNWSDLPGLSDKVVAWQETQDSRFPYRATVDQQDWQLRMNDFPDEPLYTLFIEGREIIHFTKRPSAWQIDH
jgi:hypothetical protein